MLDEKHLEAISRTLRFLNQGDDDLNREFRDKAFYVNIPAGREIFAEGDEVEGIALILSGVVRVFKLGETGREITLYRFGEGESCVITAQAILNQKDFPAMAMVEKEAEAVMVPARSFREWIDRYPAWREFFFGLVSERLAKVMEIVDEVAFQRMDRRVAGLLLERAGENNAVSATHQEIANELGSSREVISRILEDFAGREMVTLGRGVIEAMDKEKLEKQTIM